MTGVALDEALDPARTALLVVDAQRAFAHRDSPLADRGLDLSGPAESVPRVTALLGTFRDAGAPIAFTRSIRDPRTDDPAVAHDVVPGNHRGDGDLLWRPGSWEAEYVAGVEPRHDEHEVEKRGYDAFHGTPLDALLRTDGVQTLVVCGFVTDVCVEGTARGAHERGYDVVLAEDACDSYTDERHGQAVDFLASYLGAAASTARIRSALQSQNGEESIA
ncbi:MAG: isochorismatase family cysteine hydrolase [Halobacteriales archaeon]